MSNDNSLALNLPQRLRGEARSQPIDLSATYRFPFVRQRWLAGCSILFQGSMMMAVGAFLLSQIPSTPNLVVQMAIIGTLLAGGGLYVLSYAWSDFLGGLTIDQTGVQVSNGWSGFYLPWADVARWRVNDHAAEITDLTSVDIWSDDRELPYQVPGGRLSENDHHRVRQLLSALAEGREEI